jgi:DNA-binding response OmpR family regulator
LPDAKLDHLYDSIELDDFIIGPLRTEELELRASRLVGKLKAVKDQNSICIGDLLINTANFEVTVSGKRISLRYKEYELLLLMASNPGRVFSRDTLLNQIWGYEYLGGTRTVDVHIRRLRSKIEDADHTFIETVWQVGYRFKPLN